MTDIRLEITGSSIPNVRILGGQFYYKVKTCWCHEIEITENKEDGGRYFVKLPSISLIDHFKIREEGVQIFLEVWHKYLDDEKYDKKVFLGFTKLKIGDQLLSPKLNPSIKWLDIYNPIDDHHAGKILIEVFAKFVHPETLETYEESSRLSFGGEKVTNKKSSAYFNLITNSSSSGTAGSGRNGNATPNNSSSARSIEKQRNVENFTSVDDLRNSFARLRDQVPTLYKSFDLSSHTIHSEDNNSSSNSRTKVPTCTGKEKIRLFREQQEEAYLIPNKEKDNGGYNKTIYKKQPRKYLTSEQILGQEFSTLSDNNMDHKQIGISGKSNHETENVIKIMKKKSKTFTSTSSSSSSSSVSSNETDIIELKEEFDELKASFVTPKKSKSKTTQTNKTKKPSTLILQENKTCRNTLHSNSKEKAPNYSTSTNANSIIKRRTMAANFNYHQK